MTPRRERCQARAWQTGVQCKFSATNPDGTCRVHLGWEHVDDPVSSTTPASTTPAPIPPDLPKLARAIAAVGGARCQQDDSFLWTAPQHLLRKKAVEFCTGCPVLDLCRATGAKEHGGVWGGVDRG